MTTLALVSATSPEQRNALTTAYPQLHLLDCHHDRPRLAREGAEVAIVYGMVRPEELPALPKLGWIQATWAGIENLLYPAMRSREVIITNLRGQHATAMAEHAIAGLLHMLRDFPARSAAQAAGSWRCQAQVRLLADSHVLVLGTGGVGRAVIDRLLPWGARVTALNRRGDTLPGATTVTPEHLAQVLPSVDHVISTIPATAATKQLINGAFLDALRPQPIIVNVSRGAIIHEGDLLARLQDGRIGGAVLDVTDPEPPADNSPLFAHPRVLLTGHSSGAPRQDAAASGFATLQHNLACWFRNEQAAMINVVDQDAGY